MLYSLTFYILLLMASPEQGLVEFASTSPVNFTESTFLECTMGGVILVEIDDVMFAPVTFQGDETARVVNLTESICEVEEVCNDVVISSFQISPDESVLLESCSGEQKTLRFFFD